LDYSANNLYSKSDLTGKFSNNFAGEGWRRSIGVNVRKIKKCSEYTPKGASYTQQEGRQTGEVKTFVVTA
jgi:hypothetical protein